IVRADAGIEAFIDAGGDTAFAREESVAQAGNGGQQRGGRHHRASVGSSGCSSPKPVSRGRLGSEIASTLNIEPMPPRPPPTRRFNATVISSATSGDAFAISRAARVS